MKNLKEKLHGNTLREAYMHIKVHYVEKTHTQISLNTFDALWDKIYMEVRANIMHKVNEES